MLLFCYLQLVIPFKRSNPASFNHGTTFTPLYMEHKIATVSCLFRNKFCFTGGLLEGAKSMLGYCLFFKKLI